MIEETDITEDLKQFQNKLDSFCKSQEKQLKIIKEELDMLDILMKKQNKINSPENLLINNKEIIDIEE